MPKHNIIFSPGEVIPLQYESLLNQVFTKQDLIKLQKFGGRIQISLAAPYADRKSQKNDIVIDQQFVSDLQTDPESVKDKISKLTKKQLISIAEILKMSIAMKWTSKEIQNKIVQFVNAPDQWRRIAGDSK